MLNVIQMSLVSQFNAAFLTLANCIENCPPENWDQPVGNNKFSQSVFHALFFADVYLGKNLDGLEAQTFHQAHQDQFRDYEEFEDRKPGFSYDREFISKYLAFCRHKMKQSIDAETEESLDEPAGFDWLDVNRLGVHVYNIRHIQHHAAQLILRMRIDGTHDAPWVKSG